MDCGPPISSVNGDSPGKDTGENMYTQTEEYMPSSRVSSQPRDQTQNYRMGGGFFII